MDFTQKTTTEELIAFFTEVSTQDNCPSCGHEDFTVCSSSDLGAWTYAQEVLHSNIVTLEYKVYCEKCGYIRSHSAMVVDRWVKLRRESQASAGGAREVKGDNGL
ncbi:hypothetical protein [Pseudomonas huaxiensis]|uniref:hypothetical protein n=1 Tax=Pseudomonas huaxiensis TaxID=2213017 RepID=UPI000DA67A1A|nr:hypothetical protein [Pseudomonas huaxiensis]